jgi:kynurenine formamidase
MRSRTLVSLSALVTITLAIGWTVHGQTTVITPKHVVVTKADWEGWMKTDSNWGRWGKTDQLGAMNLVTAAKSKAAMALNKTGTIVSLAHKPVIIPKSKPDGISYLEIKLNLLRDAEFTIEDQQLAFHGSSFTHMDALCHGDYNGTTYNGYLVKDVISEKGCSKLAIDNLSAGVVTRGVVIDIPHLKGVKVLPPETRVTVDDIEAFEKMAGLKIGPGDAVFLHTGRWSSGSDKHSGYDITVGPWLKQRGVSIVSGDAIQDVGDGGVKGLVLPLHHYILVGMGANIIDNADLEKAAETARRLKRWEFMLTVLPVAIPGGTGFPVNPLAIF